MRVILAVKKNLHYEWKNVTKETSQNQKKTTNYRQQEKYNKMDMKNISLFEKKQPSLSTWASKKTHTDDLVQYFFVSLLILYKLKKVKESSHLSLENESKNHTEQKFGRV